MSKHSGSRQVHDALKTRNVFDVLKTHSTPVGVHLLVYLSDKGKWDGPCSLVDIQREDIIVLAPKEAQKFYSYVVRPFNGSQM